MALQSFIGSQLHVSNGVPAANAKTEAGYEGLTYTQVGQLMMLPELGDTRNQIEVPQLALGRVQRINGMADGGSAVIQIAYDGADAGQTILRTAAGTNSAVTFRIDDGHALTTSRWFIEAVIASLRYATRDGSSAYSFNLEIYPQTDLLGPYDSTN